MRDVPRRPAAQRAQPGRAERLQVAVARGSGRCLWCRRPFTALVPATTDHLVPRVKGGPSWVENEVAACRRCNGQRGHLSPADWLTECRRSGWDPDAATVVAALEALRAAITARGGQRRARPYLDAQLRRLSRAEPPPEPPPEAPSGAAWQTRPT